MKRLHRKDLYGWSSYSEKLDIDFSSVAWIREGGNVLVDPLPMTPHDLEHLEKLGGAAWIVVTNKDHVRGAAEARAALRRAAGGASRGADRLPAALPALAGRR